MDEIRAADRAEFALGEEACKRNPAKRSANCLCVVIGLAEQTSATSIAAEQQCTGCGRARSREHETQVFVRAFRVADMELHGLTDAHVIADRQRAGRGVDRRRRPERRHRHRRGRLGQAVGVVHLLAGGLQEGLLRGRGDGRTPE